MDTQINSKENKSGESKWDGFQKRKDMVCAYCGGSRHQENQCRKKMKELIEKLNKLENNPSEMVCSAYKGNTSKDWIVDSGASQHVTSNLGLLFDRVSIEDNMEMSNNTPEKCHVKGKVKIKFNHTTLILTDVYYVRNMKNIMSMTKLMSKGFKVMGQDNYFKITKGNWEVKTNHQIGTENGFIVSIKPEKIVETTNITFDLFHKRLGHPGRNATIETGKDIGEIVTTLPENIEPCEDCALAKSRQHDLLKSNSSPSRKPGERLYLETSWLSVDIFGGNKYWFLIVDDVTKMSWSRF